MSKRTVYIGPARIITAPDVRDIYGAWEDLGMTRGEVSITIHDGKIAMGRTDQTGSAPLSRSVYYLGSGVEVSFPFAEESITKLLKVAPNSVKNEAGALENIGFGDLPDYVVEQAFAIVPEFVWRQNTLDALLKSPFVHWIRKGYVSITGEFSYSLPEGDDVFSDTALECMITQTQELGVLNAGIGSLFILQDGMNVMGSSNSSQLSVVAPDSAFVTYLNSIGIDTIRDLSLNTDPLSNPLGTVTDLSGMEYAIKTTAFDFNASSIGTLPKMEGHDQIVSFDVSSCGIPEAQLSDFVNEMWKVRSSLGANFATLDIAANNGLTQKAEDQITGSGRYVGEGLQDAGVTVTY